MKRGKGVCLVYFILLVETKTHFPTLADCCRCCIVLYQAIVQVLFISCFFFYHEKLIWCEWVYTSTFAFYMNLYGKVCAGNIVNGCFKRIFNAVCRWILFFANQTDFYKKILNSKNLILNVSALPFLRPLSTKLKYFLGLLTIEYFLRELK